MQADTHSSGSSTAPDARWQAIAQAAATVVMLAQRDSGLWYLATNAAEARANYMMPGSIEDLARRAQRSAEPGSESITETYLALTALIELFGSCPPEILRSALQALEARGDDVEPAYGSLLAGLHRGKVNRSARHTAMVLAAKLLGDSGSPQSLRAVVSWILKAKLYGGGWSYEEDKRRVEPLSTAACLSALAGFLDKFPRPANDGLAEDIHQAMREGFASLRKSRLNDGLWPGIASGKTDIVDSCFVIDLLSSGTVRAHLESIVKNFGVTLTDFQKRLIAHLPKDKDGWSDSWGRTKSTDKPSLGATISALYVLNGFQKNNAVWQRRYAAIEQFVVLQLSEKDGGADLTSWDWMMLCRLAAARGCRFDQQKAVEILGAVRRFQETRREKRLKKSLPNIPKIARTAIIYLTSLGEFTEVPQALIMMGGGVKGLAFAGAMQELEQYYKFDTFVGTSAGSVAAALLAAGATGTVLEQQLWRKSFTDFLDGWRIPFTRFAILGHPGDELIRWIRQLLYLHRQRAWLKMEDLAPKRAVIYAAARGGTICFDSTGDRAGAAVHTAVRCSISIPYFFQPQMIDNRLVYDGGLLSNYPVETFLEQQRGKKWLVDFVAFYLGRHEPALLRSRWIIWDLLAIWIERNDADVVERFSNDTVVIDTRPVGTIDFDLTDDEKTFLVLAGRAAALIFLQRRGILDQTSDCVQEAHMRAKEARAKVVARRRARRERRGLVALGALVLAALLLGHWLFA